MSRQCISDDNRRNVICFCRIQQPRVARKIGLQFFGLKPHFDLKHLKKYPKHLDKPIIDIKKPKTSFKNQNQLEPKNISTVRFVSFGKDKEKNT